ncbi:MAG TPA: response regulator [Pyrinomonadaceae bacterium]|nr:response regulator [Pyrinomonadaceae bacterium]
MQPKKRILCVSKSDDTCFLISNLLRQADYDVVTAAGVEDALRLIAAGDFSLYVLGKRYADRSPLILCRRIRETDSSTPIIFYSGDAHPSSEQQALAAGAQAYILEPYLNELLETIDLLFEEKTVAAD